MGLKSCNQLLEADAPLHDLQLKSLFDNMKHTTWIVLVTIRKPQKHVERVATGVSVDHATIVTSSFLLENAVQIQVRGFSNDTFIPAERVNFDGDKYGLALLKINEECDFAEVVNDTNLIAGRDVYAIGHVLGIYRFTLMTGHLVSGLRKKDEVGIVTKEVAEMFEKKLDPEVQLLGINGFGSHFDSSICWMQALGAPVFNSKGQVIGVIVASDRGFDYAVPLHQILETNRDLKTTIDECGETSTRHVARTSTKQRYVALFNE